MRLKTQILTLEPPECDYFQYASTIRKTAEVAWFELTDTVLPVRFKTAVMRCRRLDELL
jgi:hypothetical protein